MHRGLACGGAQSPPGLDVACRDCLTEYRYWSPKSGDANTSKDKNRAGCCGSTPDWLVSRCHPTKRNYSASPRQCKTSHPDLSGYRPRNTADRLQICPRLAFPPKITNLPPRPTLPGRPGDTGRRGRLHPTRQRVTIKITGNPASLPPTWQRPPPVPPLPNTPRS